MATDRVERRMAAIVAADMVGYSRLMEADETGTLSALKGHRSELIDPTIAEHNGRIVKTTGDGMLVEFASVVDAVAGMVAIQRDMITRNETVPGDRQIEFRVGINLGDIIIDGDDIYGDGVNIAARLEQLAESGGICISGTAYDQLKAQVDVGYADLGEQRVKNIDKPVRAYKVLLDADAAGTFVVQTRPNPLRWRIPAIAAAFVFVIVAGGLAWSQFRLALDDRALPPPVNPSVAVLPFTNLSGDSFADVVQRDISNNVATTLSRLPDMFVIAWQPDNPDRDTADEVQQAAKELRIRYALQGSVRRSDDTVRITTKLIDAPTGRDLWGESYDGELRDVSAIQDEISQDAATALKANLAEDARALIVRGNTNDPEAYSLVRRGISLLEGATREENAEARDLFQKAVEEDPSYLISWHLLSYTYSASSRRGWAEHPEQERAEAEELADKVWAINPSAAGPYILLSTISRLTGQYDEPVALARKAFALVPKDAMTVAHLGQAMVFSGNFGQPEEVLSLFQRAILLSPYTPPPILFYEGLAYHRLGRYKEAMAEFERVRSSNPKGLFPLALLAITSADLGRMEEARAAADALRAARHYRIFSAKEFVNALGYEDRAKSEHALAILQELGLPE